MSIMNFPKLPLVLFPAVENMASNNQAIRTATMKPEDVNAAYPTAAPVYHGKKLAGGGALVALPGGKVTLMPVTFII